MADIEAKTETGFTYITNGNFTDAEKALLAQATDSVMDSLIRVAESMRKPWYWTGKMEEKMQYYAAAVFTKNQAGKIEMTFKSNPYGIESDIQKTAGEFKILSSFLLGQMHGAAIGLRREAPTITNDSYFENSSLGFKSVEALAMAVNSIQLDQDKRIDVPEKGAIR